MTLQVKFDALRGSLMVGDETLREFYIRMRQEADIPISKLEKDIGIDHPLLYNVEKGYNVKGERRYSNAVSPILAALDCMGFKLYMEG